VPNQGRVNWVFKHAGVPYGPHLALSSKTSEEAAKKRKQDAGARSQSKRVKVLGHRTTSVKVAMTKTTQSKSSRMSSSKDASDVSYAAPQAHGIVNVTLHQEYSPSIIFIFSQGRKDLYHA
jgi:hypothetical protein